MYIVICKVSITCLQRSSSLKFSSKVLFISATVDSLQAITFTSFWNITEVISTLGSWSGFCQYYWCSVGPNIISKVSHESSVLWAGWTWYTGSVSALGSHDSTQDWTNLIYLIRHLWLVEGSLHLLFSRSNFDMGLRILTHDLNHLSHHRENINTKISKGAYMINQNSTMLGLCWMDTRCQFLFFSWGYQDW